MSPDSEKSPTDGCRRVVVVVVVAMRRRATRARAMRRRATLAVTLGVTLALGAGADAASSGGAVAVTVRRTPARARVTARGRRLAATSSADAIPIRAYGAGLGNAHGGGHEFSLSVTLAGGQTFDLIVDTGSSLTYLACWFGEAAADEAQMERCGYEHEHPYYDVRRSDAFRVLNVTTNAADAAYCRSDARTQIVDDGTGLCEFGIGYVDESEAVGIIVEDTMMVGDELASANMSFGCGCLVEADGTFPRQDGMAGFGRGPTTFHTQLAKAGVIDADVFGFCSEGAGTNEAMLSLGHYDFGSDRPPLAWTRMLGDDDLAARTMSWKLGDKTISGSHNVYTVLDSGTTMTYVPEIMYEAFMVEFMSRMIEVNVTYSDIIYFDAGNFTCFYSMAGSLTKSVVRSVLPKLTITYDPDIALVLPPENYLFSHPAIPLMFCVGVGVLPGVDDQILLGQQSLRNTFVEYDLDNKMIGLTVAKCENLRKKYAVAAPRDRWRFVAVLFIILYVTSLVGAIASIVWYKKYREKDFTWRVLDGADLLDSEIELSDATRDIA